MTTPASIAKHPIHTILVPIPIGAWIFALVADVAASMNGDPAWRAAAFYAIGVGIVGALLAAVPGLIDLLSLPSGASRRTGIWHMSFNLVAVAVFAVNFAMRWDDPSQLGSPVLTVLGILLIGVAGWLGGEMVYRGGVGVASDAKDASTASDRREGVPGRPLDARSR
jgi:uncharacterized membrane protein